MTIYESWLGKPVVDFSTSYPQIEEIRIDICQDKSGYYIKRSPMKYFRFNKNNIQPNIPCVNPQCRRGGFDIDNMIANMVLGMETSREYIVTCMGDESSPKGRRPGESCLNVYDANVNIIYKETVE